MQALQGPLEVGIDATLEDKTPVDEKDSTENTNFVYALLSLKFIEEPKSYKDAMNSKYVHDWCGAMDSEYKSLMENKTWTLVSLPKGRKALKNRWVYVIKRGSDGSIERFKARLVIKGFLQRFGIDYNEIFSPVVRMEVLRILLAIGAALDWEIEQMDVKTAFLNGYLDEEIYMEQPEGYAVKARKDWCVSC